VESLNKVCAKLNEATIAQHFIPLVFKLSSGNFFTSRASGCGLHACCYKRAGASQEELKV